VLIEINCRSWAKLSDGRGLQIGGKSWKRIIHQVVAQICDLLHRTSAFSNSFEGGAAALSTASRLQIGDTAD
jgi:hypothetical protein